MKQIYICYEEGAEDRRDTYPYIRDGVGGGLDTNVECVDDTEEMKPNGK